MARPATGSVRVRTRNGHSETTLRFSAYGQRYEIPAGTDDAIRARGRLDEILDQIRRGIWQPPTKTKPKPPRAAEPTFGEFADAWFQQIAPTLSERGREDYLWALNQHLLPYFTAMLLSEITVESVDKYRQAKVREGKLGPTSINKTIARLGQILDLAVEYGYIAANPARGKRRRLKQGAPRRSFLEADQVIAVLDAAGELDREATHYRRIGRRAIMATLILAGLRVSELCVLRWEAVDLAGGGLYVRERSTGRSKTEAGVRVIPISGFLRDELIAYKAQAVESELVFPTGTGKQRNRNNVRNRIHNPSIKRANDELAKAQLPLIQPGLTPHGLRRTFISLLLEAGENPRNVMAWAGHSDPGITMRIYAQVLSRPGSRDLAQSLTWKPGEWNGVAVSEQQRPIDRKAVS